MAADDTDPASHWVRWHAPYEDPDSALSVRLRLVQAALRRALDQCDPGPIRIVSLCAGQGRDVIDVLAQHPRAGDVAALLVELDPGLVAFARQRSVEFGLTGQVTVVQGDASQCACYADAVPVDVVLVCGIFGNISLDDITHTVHALPMLCAPKASVIWTRHRRQPDATPRIRADFAAAGFEEVSFDAPPDPHVLTVGHDRLAAEPVRPFRPEVVLFDFVGDGGRPA